MIIRLLRNLLIMSLVVLGTSLGFSYPASAATSGAGIPDAATLDFYDANGIYYYNPNDNCVDLANGSAGVVSGDDNAAKAWNYFVTANINGISDNPVAIAGVLGNFKAESEYNPYSHDSGSSYYGIYQTDSKSMIQKIENEAGNYWGKSGSDVPEDANDKAMKIELDYLVSNKPWSDKRWDNYVKAVRGVTDPGVAAELFMVTVERCVGSSHGNGAPLTSSEAKNQAKKQYGSGSQHINGLWQATDKRRTYAEDAYKKFATSAPSTSEDSSSQVTTTDGSNVTIIGDSLTVSITNKSNKDEVANTNLINGLDQAYVNAKIGRGWDAGIDIVKKLKKDNQLSKIVIFALGTNNTNGIKKSDLQKVYQAVGTDKQLFFVTNFSTKDSIQKNFEKTNTVMEAFASSHSNVSVIPYARTIGEDPNKYMEPDGIHLNSEGQKKYRELIIDAINNDSSSKGYDVCNSSAAQGNGNLSKTAIDLAWPYTEWQQDHSKIKKAKQSYKDALKKVLGNYGYMGEGLACNQFVATVVIYSGVDPNFEKGVTDNQSIYMSNHPNLYKLISDEGGAKSTDNIQPGDIFVNNSHIWIAAEDTDGTIKRVQASLGDETGLVKGTIQENLNYAKSFKQFRYIGRTGGND